MGLESVDEYVDRWVGTKNFTTEFKTKRDSIAHSEFEEIVTAVLLSEDFKSSVRAFKINDKEIWVEVKSRGRGIPWTFRLSFDDDGRISGNYRPVFVTYDTANIWRNIGSVIHNRIISARYLKRINGELISMLWI